MTEIKHSNKSMTAQQMGYKGGKARADRHSKEELSAQAKKAAQTIEEERPGFHAEIGQKGGEARAAKYNKEELSEQAKRAAQTIEEKHPGFHAEIGQKGGSSKKETLVKGADQENYGSEDNYNYNEDEDEDEDSMDAEK